jgi:hypothetical protein
MTMPKLLPLLLFSALLLTGCDSSDSNSPEAGETLIPLVEGNEWTMSVEGRSVPDGQTVTLRMSGEENIRGETYRQIDYATSDGFNGESALVARTSDRGLYIARRDVEDLYGFELRRTVSDGDTYVHTDERGNSYDVIVSEQSITVPAGTFDVMAYRVTRQSNGNTDTAFIAPGIGPVQLDFRGEIYRLESTNVE